MKPAPQSGLDWIKARGSYASSACVELARYGDDTIYLRDSKNPGVHLRYTNREIAAFIEGAKNGDFDGLLGAGG